jgi:hypothetical protein
MRAQPNFEQDNSNFQRPTWACLPEFQPPEEALSHHRFKQTRITTGDLLDTGFQIQNDFEDNDDDGINALFGDYPPSQQPPQHEEPEVFVPRPVKSRRIEREMFGGEDDENNNNVQCFGCEYLDDYNKRTTIPTDDIEHLRSMGRECFGRMQTAILARGMSHFYEKFIRAKINANLQPGEDALPPWKEAKVLEHLRYHHQDPQVKLVVLLEETEELRTELYDRCLEESTKTGRVRANSRVINDYDKVVKLQLHIQSKDPSKMAFYNPGARVNPESLNQGILSTRTKKLHDYWK